MDFIFLFLFAPFEHAKTLVIYFITHQRHSFIYAQIAHICYKIRETV